MSVLNINTNNALNLYIQNVDTSYYNNLLTTSSATLTYSDSSNNIKSSVYDNNAIYFVNQQTNPNINTTINYEKIEAIQPYLIKSNVSLSLNSPNVYITGNTDITGSLKMAGNAGFNGQVLASNGTTATWIDLPVTSNGGWVGLAQSDLNMNGRNISNVITIDASGTSLSIGNTSSTSILIGKSGIITSILGDTSMNNVSINNLSVSGNSSMNNVSINNLSIRGDTSMNNVSINNLSVKINATFISDVSVNGYTQLNNVSSNNFSILNLSVKNNTTFVNDVSVNGYTQLNNVSSNNVSISNLSVKSNATFDNTVLITGQTTFITPPNVPDPIFGNDAASKGYVDSLVGQYSGGFNLFFNYFSTDTRNSIVYRVLSQTVSDAVQQSVDTSITTGQVLVAQFITPQLNITSIPAGLWNTLIYGAVNDSTDTITYSFKLFKISSGNTITQLATESSNSIDINTSPNTNPIAYTMNMTISTPISLVVSDSLIISIYINRTGTGSAIAVRTYFENNYYSFTQSTLNAGTTLLSSNNVWAGTNDFSIGIKSQTLDTSGSATLTLGGTNATAINIGKTNVSANMSIANASIINTPSIDSGTTLSLGTATNGTIIGKLGQTTNIQGNLQIAGSAGSNNQVLTSNGTTATWQATQWVGTATSALNMSIYSIATATIDASSATTALSIGASQTGTDAILNLGTNAARTGAINLGGLGSTGKLNLNRPLTIAYSVTPVAGDLGYRQFLTSVGATTSTTAGTVTMAIELLSQPIGIHLYEIRYNYSTIAVVTTSIGPNASTHGDGSFAVTTPNTIASTGYFKNVQVYGLSAIATQYINISSNVSLTVITAISVIRTRLG